MYAEMTTDYDSITDPVEKSILLETWKFGRMLTIAYTS